MDHISSDSCGQLPCGLLRTYQGRPGLREMDSPLADPNRSVHSDLDGGADMAEKLIAWGVAFIVILVVAIFATELFR